MRSLGAILYLLLTTFTLVTFGHAQQPSVTKVDVIVVDRGGAIIPQAVIKAQSEETGAVTFVRMAADGVARLTLSPGQNQITVSAEGFQSQSRQAQISSGSEQSLTVVLQIAPERGWGPGASSLPAIPLPEVPVLRQLIPLEIPRHPFVLRTKFVVPNSQESSLKVKVSDRTGVPVPGAIDPVDQAGQVDQADQTPCISAAATTNSQGWNPSADGPDQILFEGIILTGNCLDAGKREIVSAMAITNGKIAAVGSDAEMKRLAGPKTNMRDLQGAFVMPGLNDAHVHLGGAGQTKLNVDLTGSASLSEMLKRIELKAGQSPAGHWLTGGGWDHTLWSQKTLPTRQDLDAVTGDHPALLERIDGHIAVANTAALKAAGITDTTKAPLGGSIDLDANGKPTGILRDTEMEEVEKVIPPPSHDDRVRGLSLAIEDALAHGLTSVQDNSEWADFLVMEELERDGKLDLRISEWLPFAAPLDTLVAHRAHHDQNDPMLHTGMLKGFMDGSLGSRTAAMKEPYADEPGNSGLARYDQSKLNAMAIERAKAGFQIGFHAIGDKAASMALEAFSQTYDACPELAPQDKNPYKVLRCWPTVAGTPGKSHRDRIEHAQVVDPADIARFKQLGVIASMQPNHLLTDMNWAMDRLGPQRAAYSYAWKAFLNAGVVLAFGTDYPVEPVTPFRGLYAAVTRENEAGSKSYYPVNKLTRDEALYAYTQGSAYAEFEETQKGKLVAGYDADYILLDRNLLTVPAPEILKTQVLETVVGGKTVYTLKR